MFFLYALFLIILIILFVVPFEIVIINKENLKIKFKIIGISIISKNIKTKENIKIKSSIDKYKKKLLDLKNSIKDTYKVIRIITKLKGKIKINEAEFNIWISNINYIKGAYYIAAINTLTFMARNISENVNTHYSYRVQNKDLEIRYRLNIRFKLYNTLITFIKLVIIFSKVEKKGKMKNGTTSNRKFNGNCDVIN